MKKAIIFVAIISAVVSLILGDGTVRIYTKSGWFYKDDNSSTPPAGPWTPAVIINHYVVSPGPPRVDNPWDRDAGHFYPYFKVVPWEKLYKQTLPDSAFWIGISNTGEDIFEPNSRDTIWFMSPVFHINEPEKISRVTLWVSCDDICDRVFLLDLVDHSAWLFPIDYPINEFTTLHRYDLTDFFWAYQFKPSHDFCLAFRVINTMASYIGMISYFSFDYGDPVSYRYSLVPGWNYISMPFRPVDPSATLSTLFPDIAFAYFLSWEDGDWHPIPLDVPLTGSIGDTVRTYSVMMAFTDTSHTTISGYPVFEQRYLDILTNNYLGFGTITMRGCPLGRYAYVPFEDDEPDDFRDWKITGNATAYLYGGSWVWGVDEVREGRGYLTKPHPTTPGHSSTSENLPYHLDIIEYTCAYPHLLSSESEEVEFGEDETPWGEELVPFYVSEEDIEKIEEIDRLISEMDIEEMYGDSSFIRDYLEQLDSVSRIVVSEPPSLPPFPVIGFHKTTVKTSTYNNVVRLELSAYPTPFNSNLNISLSLDEPAVVSVDVYDVSGKLVRHIYSGELGAGSYSFKWDGESESGKDVSSGVYLIRAAAENYVVERQVVLVR